MKNIIFLLLSFSVFPAWSQRDSVNIVVDLHQTSGPLKHIWNWVGYDEPNYTYMKDGKKLLTELANANTQPVHVRVHSLLVTGDGEPALKWGSTNAYTEDAQGNPIYNWTIIDKIFDTFLERGMKPMPQIGFMPEALSSKPVPYRHYWKPGDKYDDIYTGWAYPPNNYEKFATLVYEWVKHSVERYGKKEVESWYWELWNEPNIGYWKGTTEEYIKLYDYTADAVKRALPTAKIGGPEVTGPSWDASTRFFKAFLDHVSSGKNYVTGKKGSPLDFITFHAKGSPRVVDGTVRMGMSNQLRDIESGFKLVRSYPKFKDLPIVIGESDPEGCAACSEANYPHYAYRNGTMYSSYTAASFARKLDLAEQTKVNLLGAVSWSFEFENQPWFAGFRDMATNGVDKPVLNVFRMFGMMSGQRAKVSGDMPYTAQRIVAEGVRGERRDINALASADKRSAFIMLWNYHDDDKIGADDKARVVVNGLPSARIMVHHYQIDQEHSNSYTAWKRMGSPQQPSEKQIKELERAGELQLLTSPYYLQSTGSLTFDLSLPQQGVSFLKFTW
jgi:xylan 1,4-beta-xylosidase